MNDSDASKTTIMGSTEPVGGESGKRTGLKHELKLAKASIKATADYLDYLTPKHPLYTTVYKEYINKQKEYLDLLIIQEE